MKLRGAIFPVVILTWTTINGFFLNKLHPAGSIEGTSIGENINGHTKVSNIPTAIPTNSVTFIGNSDYNALLNLKKREIGEVKGILATKVSELSNLKNKKLAFIRTLLAAKLTPIITLIRSKPSLIQPWISGKQNTPGQTSTSLNFLHRPLNLLTGALSAIPALSNWKPNSVPKKYIFIKAHEFETTPKAYLYGNQETPISAEPAKYPHVLFNALVAAKKHVYSSALPESTPEAADASEAGETVETGETGEAGDTGETVTETELEAVREPCPDPPMDTYDDYVDDEDIGSPLPLFEPEPFFPQGEVSIASANTPQDVPTSNYILPANVIEPAPVYEYERPVHSGSSFTAFLPPAPTLPPFNYGPPLQFPVRTPETSYGAPINGEKVFGETI